MGISRMFHSFRNRHLEICISTLLAGRHGGSLTVTVVAIVRWRSISFGFWLRLCNRCSDSANGGECQKHNKVS